MNLKLNGHVALDGFMQIMPANHCWVDLSLKIQEGKKRETFHRSPVILWGLTKSGEIQGVVDVNGNLMVVERNKDLKAMYRVFHPNQVTADKKFAEWMEKRKTFLRNKED